ncbi:MAG: hypothetical protein GEU86_03750 [Actinophytocola sp.]|nr:hypothetical protein [Actinophytocola sp.]
MQQIREYAARAQRDLHARLDADLKAAKQTALSAQRRADHLQRRTERAERKLAELRASRTWRTGKAVLWLPSVVRRRLGHLRGRR